MFGQVVIGSPGSGKSTYCAALSDSLARLGRCHAVVNLDPANEYLPYKADICIRDLIRLEDVMEERKLGPNGALLYCMEFLLANAQWLIDRLTAAQNKHAETQDAAKQPLQYLIFDLPGQVELYTQHDAMRDLLALLTAKQHGYRLVCVHLVDAVYCANPTTYVSILLTSLSAMLQLEMPHMNVLSKCDLLDQTELPFNLEVFTDVQNLQYVMERSMPEPSDRVFGKLTQLAKSLCDVIHDYSLVAFEPLSVKRPATMLSLLHKVDAANGYCFGLPDEHTLKRLLGVAYSQRTDEDRETFMKRAFETVLSAE